MQLGPLRSTLHIPTCNKGKPGLRLNLIRGLGSKVWPEDNLAQKNKLHHFNKSSIFNTTCIFNILCLAFS